MTPSRHDAKFISYLERLAERDHRAALSDLAAELGRPPGSTIRSLRWLSRWTSHASPAEQARRHLVAALFAVHPQSATHGNVGHTVARVARARGLTPSLERRFVALLEADAQDVGHHLRSLVGLARAAGVPVAWAQLLADLRRWDDPLRRVQSEWARGLWASEALRGADEENDMPSEQQQAAALQPEGEMGDGTGTASAAELCALLSEP